MHYQLLHVCIQFLQFFFFCRCHILLYYILLLFSNHQQYYILYQLKMNYSDEHNNFFVPNVLLESQKQKNRVTCQKQFQNQNHDKRLLIQKIQSLFMIFVQKKQKIFCFEKEIMGNTCSGQTERGKFNPPTMVNNHYKRIGSSSADIESLKRSEIELLEKSIGVRNQSVENKDLVEYIMSSEQKVFRDKQFCNQNWVPLSTLVNKRMNQVFESNMTRFDSIKQNQLELSYMASPLYMLCKHPQLKQKIFITNQMNLHEAYILNFFCNGKKTKVVIDQTIPIEENQEIKHLNVIRGNQVWPYLLEKAWCKEIGGYDKARGLSPDDAIEEITGLPAYSYELKFVQNSLIEDLAADKSCSLFFTAKISTGSRIKSRQIFFLQAYDSSDFYLRSPYFEYDYERQSRGSTRIVMNIKYLRSYFDYVSVGFCYPNYTPISYPLKAKKRQLVSYLLRVEKQEPINIRFVQFYEGYLPQEERNRYDYSSVYFELLDEDGKFIEGSEGCNNSISGSRSSNVFETLFMTLKKGRYYLRMEVDWLNEDALCEGSVVVYATQDNAILTRVNNSGVPISEVGTYGNSDNEEILVKFVQRKHRYLIQVRNMKQKTLNTSLIFQKIENVRVHGYSLENNSISLLLQGHETKTIIILPEDNRYPFSVEKFKIGVIN